MPSGKRNRLGKQNIQNQERNSNGYFLKRVLLCQECCVVPVVATVAAADVVAAAVLIMCLKSLMTTTLTLLTITKFGLKLSTVLN